MQFSPFYSSNNYSGFLKFSPLFIFVWAGQFKNQPGGDKTAILPFTNIKNTSAVVRAFVYSIVIV